MAVIKYDYTENWNFPRLVNAAFVCTTLIRFCGLIYIILGALMIISNGVLYRDAFPFLNQFTIGGMPLGNLTSGVVYALFSLLPLHTIFGSIGVYGALRRKPNLIVIHTVFLLFGITVDIVFIVLLSMTLNAVDSWLSGRFSYYYQNTASLNNEVRSALNALSGALKCDATHENGCWEQYYQIVEGNIQISISLLCISILLEIITIVLSNLIYGRLGKQGRSSSMFIQCGRFVRQSWNTRRTKLFFVVVQNFDLIASFVLLIGGAVICRSRFIIDVSVLPVFENLRFNNYYLPEIVIGLAVTTIMIGFFNLLSSCIGLNMVCYKSRTKVKVYVIYQIVMMAVTLIELIFWMNLLTIVKDEMSDQLAAEFLVYGDTGFTLSTNLNRAWNYMFLAYSCCGVKSNNSFEWTKFGRGHLSDNRPRQCGTGATLANTDIESTGVPVNDYYNEFKLCDVPLKNELQAYTILFGVTGSALLIFKVYNVIMMNRNVLDVGDPDGNEISFSQTIKNSLQYVLPVLWSNTKMMLGSIAFAGIGLILAVGILVTGVTLRFNALLGHKDIQPLLAHVFVSGWDLKYLVRTMSDVIITWGTVSFIIFGIGLLSVVVKVTRMYYVSVLLLIISILFKCVSISVWIPMRVALDSNLADAMITRLRDSYQTDKPHTESYMEETNLGFNTLFFEGNCCLHENSLFQTRGSQMINTTGPWTCGPCPVVSNVRWPLLDTVDNDCFKSPAYSMSCTDALSDSIHLYDTTAVILGILMILLEVLLVISLDRQYKSLVSPGQSRGLFSNTCFNNRYINNNRMPNFTQLTVVYVTGSLTLSLIQLSYWIAILVYLIRDDTQLDQIYLGPLNLSTMTRGASITLLVSIPIYITVSVVRIRWCLLKWNTGLRLSLLPETGLLIIDIVIFCLCAQQLELIRLSSQNIYPVMYRINFAYLCINIAMQVILILIKDRLHKRIDISCAEPRPSGMFSTIWRRVVTHRYFQISGIPNKKLLVFTILSLLLMLMELAIGVVILVEGFAPGYYFNELYNVSGKYRVFAWGVTIAALVEKLIYVIIHNIAIIAAIKQHKESLKIVSCLLALMLLTDIIMTGLVGVLLDKAYNCNDLPTYTVTVSPQKFCGEELYNLAGAFIGLTVCHLVIVGILLWLCLKLASLAHSSTSVMPS